MRYLIQNVQLDPIVMKDNFLQLKLFDKGDRIILHSISLLS